MALIAMWGMDDTAGETGLAISNGQLLTTGRGITGGCWNSQNFGQNDMTLTFPTAPSAASFVLGFGYNNNIIGSNRAWCKILDNASNVQFSLGFDSLGHVVLYRGNLSAALATSSFIAKPAVWYYMELKLVVHASAGSADLHVDGPSVVSVSGANTSTVAFTSINAVQFGGSSTSGNGQTYVDDVYLLDLTGSAPYNTYLGDVAVRSLYPSAAGDLTQWTPSTGANWDAVNEVASSATDYVGASTTGLKDLYQCNDLPALTTVLAYQTWTYAAKTDAGVPPTTSAITKGDGGTTRTDSPSLPLSTTYQHLQGPIYTTDPDGDALTLTNMNAMQVGVST